MRVQKIIPHKLLTRNVHNCLVLSMKGFSAIFIIWLLVGRPTVCPKISDDEYIFDGIMTLESCLFASGIVSMFPSVSPSNIRFTQMLMFLVKVSRCFYFQIPSRYIPNTWYRLYQETWFLAWAWLAKAKGHSCHTKNSTLAKTFTKKNE